MTEHLHLIVKIQYPPVAFKAEKTCSLIFEWLSKWSFPLTLSYHQSGKHGWSPNERLSLVHWPESSPGDPTWCTNKALGLNGAI